jgi:hypothetical protein
VHHQRLGSHPPAHWRSQQTQPMPSLCEPRPQPSASCSRHVTADTKQPQRRTNTICMDICTAGPPVTATPQAARRGAGLR